MGISATLQSIDFGKLRDFRTSTVETMTKGLAGLLSHRGVTVFRGEAELRTFMMCMSRGRGRSAGHVFLQGGSGGTVGSELTIKGEDIVLATGSRPLPLPGNPFSGALIDSTQALELDTFPSSAVIVGAGAVALEFASLWNAAGCEVTLLIRKDRVLSSWEKRASMTLTRELKRRGISVVTRASVDYVDTGANLGATVHYRQGGGEEERTAYGEVVLAAIGRMPNTDAGWFASNGIELEERGYVSTDAYGRTKWRRMGLGRHHSGACFGSSRV